MSPLHLRHTHTIKHQCCQDCLSRGTLFFSEQLKGQIKRAGNNLSQPQSCEKSQEVNKLQSSSCPEAYSLFMSVILSCCLGYQHPLPKSYRGGFLSWSTLTQFKESLVKSWFSIQHSEHQLRLIAGLLYAGQRETISTVFVTHLCSNLK